MYKKRGAGSFAMALVLAAVVTTLTSILVIKKIYRKPGIVVILNGTSSSGKTSIIKELIKIDPTLKVESFDEFWGSYTKTHSTKELDELAKIARTNEKANQKLNQLAEVYIRKAFDSFYAQIAGEARKNKNVVLDTVIEDIKEFDKMLQALRPIKSVSVLLYCPLDVTLARLKQRNLAGVDPRDFRQPTSQYKLLYKPQESPAEQIVDTISSAEIKQLLRTGIDEYLKDPPAEIKDQVQIVAKELEVFYKDFVKHFKLDELEKVVIVPVRPYDLVLSCQKASHELAQELAKFMATFSNLSPWQLSIEQIFAAKKSGQFEAKDKNGAPIILEWLVTNVHEPEYIQMMHSVADIFVQSFGSQEVRFLKAHPEAVTTAVKNTPFNAQLQQLFKDGIEKVDWKAVEEKMASMACAYWEGEATGADALKRYAHSLFVFIIAKDTLTQNLLGFVTYRIDDDDPRGAVIIEPLAVIPEAQKRGLGKLLVASIFKMVPAVTRINLIVESKNDNAIKAYQAWGFVEFQAPDQYHKNMEYRVEKSEILQKIAQTIKNGAIQCLE